MSIGSLRLSLFGWGPPRRLCVDCIGVAHQLVAERARNVKVPNGDTREQAVSRFLDQLPPQPPEQ